MAGAPKERAVRSSRLVWLAVAVVFAGVVYLLGSGGGKSTQARDARFDPGGPVEIDFLGNGEGEEVLAELDEAEKEEEAEKENKPPVDPWVESRRPYYAVPAQPREDPAEKRAREARRGSAVIANRWSPQDVKNAELAEAKSDDGSAAEKRIGSQGELRSGLLARLDSYLGSSSGNSASSVIPPESVDLKPLPREITPGTLTAGSSIPARLETAISSDAAGVVRAVVVRDVYDFYQKSLVIPAQSRLVGTVDRGGLDQDGGRVEIGWDEIQYPDGRRRALPRARGYDRDGSAAVSGKVKRRVWRTMGQAAVLSAISAGFGTGRGAAGSGARYDASTTMGRAAEELVRQGISARPTVYVPAGTNILVILEEDFQNEFAQNDLVKEMMR